MLGGKSVQINRTIGASVGSKVTSSAMNKAISTSKDSRSASLALPADQPARLPVSGKVTHPGSRAGLKDAKSAHLHMNDTGYLNPANQTARLKNRTKLVDTSIGNRRFSQKTHTRMNDSRLTCSKTSSISRIQKIS